jgi:hypothetical protein
LLVVAVGLLVSWATHGERYVALTDRKVILAGQSPRPLCIRYETVVSADLERNHLFCREEVVLRRRMSKGRVPKVEYLDSIPSPALARLTIREQLRLLAADAQQPGAVPSQTSDTPGRAPDDGVTF